MKPEHPASTFNKIRHHIFSTYHQIGGSAAKDLLDTYLYQNRLNNQWYRGLKAELLFYDKYRHKYSLTVAEDTGEHVDFSGIVNGRATRFDVTTTNGWAFKKFSDYEPFMPSLNNPCSFQYLIPVFDGKDFIIQNACDLLFERCDCGGCLIPIILIGNEEMDKYGCRTFMNDQYTLLVCNQCCLFTPPKSMLRSGYLRPENDIYEEIEMQYIDSPSEFQSEMSEIGTRISNQYASIYRGLQEELPGNLMAIATQDYRSFGYKNQDCYWILTIQFLHPMIKEIMPSEIQIGNPIIPY